MANRRLLHVGLVGISLAAPLLSGCRDSNPNAATGTETSGVGNGSGGSGTAGTGTSSAGANEGEISGGSTGVDTPR